jgi:mannose-1-phosphate guanylyltransferase
MRYAMIMAGGAGTRLWPMSRTGRPKQLLKFVHQDGGTQPRCLLEIAAARLDGLIAPERCYICTAESYRAGIREALPDFADERILGEPMGRDTLNAIGLAAAVFEKQDPGAIFAVLTADHIIEPRATFQRIMEVGYKLVEQDPSLLVTFAIKPTYAATGFGYVERGAPLQVEGVGEPVYRVQRFVEKPDLPRAKAYVESGFFSWNSGMFVWKAATFLAALKRFKPESYAGLKLIQDAWGTPAQQQVLAEVYPTLPKISVDYAVMEPASKARDREFTVCTLQMDVQWLDVGSWPSYGQTVPADSGGNRVAFSGTGAGGETVLQGSSNNLVVNPVPGHTIALLGCKDLIVIHTPEATLVMPRDKAEELKELHARVREDLK